MNSYYPSSRLLTINHVLSCNIECLSCDWEQKIPISLIDKSIYHINNYHYYIVISDDIQYLYPRIVFYIGA